MKLEDIKNKNGFSVPEGYFEQQKQELLKIPANQSKSNVRSIRFGWTQILAAAAILAFVVSLGSIYFKSTETDSTLAEPVVLYSDVELEYYTESLEELSFDLVEQSIELYSDSITYEEQYLLDYASDQLYYEL